MSCAACRGDLGRPERVGRRDVCPHCGVDLHACRQCRFYDRRAAHECRESAAEPVRDKARSNFCDWFALATGAAEAEAPPAESARAALGRLFRPRSG